MCLTGGNLLVGHDNDGDDNGSDDNDGLDNDEDDIITTHFIESVETSNKSTIDGM